MKADMRLHSITHMAEELPNPRKQLPIGIAAQILLGTFSEHLTFGVNQ